MTFSDVIRDCSPQLTVDGRMKTNINREVPPVIRFRNTIFKCGALGGGDVLEETIGVATNSIAVASASGSFRWRLLRNASILQHGGVCRCRCRPALTDAHLVHVINTNSSLIMYRIQFSLIQILMLHCHDSISQWLPFQIIPHTGRFLTFTFLSPHPLRNEGLL
jgi:hypothetical protein